MAAPSPRFASLRALRYPAFARIWAGAFFSSIGSWVQTISVGIYATETTGKAFWTGTMAAMAYLPALLIGPLAGALADRLDRRRLMVLTTSVQAAIAAILSALALADRLPLGLLASLLFLAGCVSALGSPAFNALLSELVGPEDLLSALSLTSGQFNLARAVGPMVAALVFARGGIKLAFLVNSLSFFAVLVALLWKAGPPTHRAAKAVGSVWQGIAQGFQVARSEPGIRLALLLTLALAVLVAPFIGLMPAFAIKVFGKGSTGASALVSSQGVGALVAALFANAVAEAWGVRRLMRRALLAVPPLAICYWLAPEYWLALVLLAPLGAMYLWSLSSVSTTCMGRVSRDLQARMSSLYTLTLSGGYALGLFLQGSLADRFGLRMVPAVAAALLFLAVLWLRRQASFAAVDAPSAYGGFIRPADE